MKDKILSILRYLEKNSSEYRQQQKVSRDPKKQFYWLGNCEATAKAISLIKRSFVEELRSEDVDNTTKK